MKNLVTNGFINYAEDRLIIKAKYIFDQMSRNVNIFATPNPSLSDLQKLTDKLDKDNLAAQSKDRIMLAVLSDTKLEMVDFLQRLGLYVNVIADGSRTIALLSGFDVRKENEPRILNTPGTPIAARGQVLGTVEAACGWQKATTTSVWYITTDSSLPLEQWTVEQGAGAKVVFKSCTPGVTYSVVVVMYGPRKQRVVSPPATVVA